MLKEQSLQDTDRFACPEPRGSAGYSLYQIVCGRAEKWIFELVMWRDFFLAASRLLQDVLVLISYIYTDEG